MKLTFSTAGLLIILGSLSLSPLGVARQPAASKWPEKSTPQPSEVKAKEESDAVTAVSWLLLDLNQNEMPDTLWGPELQKDRMKSLIPQHYAKFSFVPESPQFWEWIAGTDAFLVWDPEKTKEVKDGTQFIGSQFKKQTWESALDALKSLDKNDDGVLNKAELKGVAVWQDVNSNAIADPWEVAPLEDLKISEIRWKAQGPEKDGQVGEVKMGDEALIIWQGWSRQKPPEAPDLEDLPQPSPEED